MKKVGLVVLAMLFVTTLACANSSRIAGMGLQSWMLTDDTNIWFDPAALKDLGGRAWWEMGSGGAGFTGFELTNKQWGGIAFGSRLFGAAGVFFGRPYTGITPLAGTAAPTVLGVADDALSAATFGANPGLGLTGWRPIYSIGANSMQNVCDIFLGLPLFLPVAIRYTLAAGGGMNSHEFWTTPKANNDGLQRCETYAYEHTIAAGVHLGQLIPILPIEVFGSFGIPIVNSTYMESVWNAGNSKFYTESTTMTVPGAYNISVGARLPFEMIGLPVFIFGQYTINNLPAVIASQRDNDADDTADRNVIINRLTNKQTIEGGISVNLKIGQGLLVGGVAGNWVLTNISATDSDPNVAGWSLGVYDSFTYISTVISLPIYIAYEHPLFWGFVGRAGLTYTPTWTQSEAYDCDYNANKVLTTERRVITPTLAGTTIAVSLGLNKQLSDALSFDMVVRQTGSTAPAYEGILGMFATQMTVNWLFK